MDVDAFISELEANGRSKYTIQSYRDVLNRLNKFKPLDTITKPDLVRFFKGFKGTDETKRLYQAKIKKFFIDNGKEALVSWIKLIQIKEKLKPDDILDTDDINKLIESTASIYFKAWIALAFESGARFNELKQLRYKDFKETNQGLIVTIPTSKSDAVRPAILLLASSNYIRNLKAHAMMKESDLIFPMSRQNVALHLEEIKKQAGITKPITPHKFRHAQATDMTKRNYTEAIIRAKLAWKPGSRMPSRYQHLNSNAVVEATLANGGKMPESPALTEVKQGDKITLVDAAMQFSKLSEENVSLKAEMEKTNEYLKKLERKIIDSRGEMVTLMAESLRIDIKTLPDHVKLMAFRID
jgi:site-specific recombinase XerD